MSEYMPPIGTWVTMMVMWTFLFLLNLGAVVLDAVVGPNWFMLINVIGMVGAPYMVLKSKQKYDETLAKRQQIRRERYERWLEQPAPSLTGESVTWAEYEAEVEIILSKKVGEGQDPFEVDLRPELVRKRALERRKRREARGEQPHPDSLESYTKQFGDKIAHLYRIPPPAIDDRNPFRRSRPNKLDRLPPREWDTDDRMYHAVCCNRSPENQKRNLPDVCNCPRSAGGGVMRDDEPPEPRFQQIRG